MFFFVRLFWIVFRGHLNRDRNKRFFSVFRKTMDNRVWERKESSTRTSKQHWLSTGTRQVHQLFWFWERQGQWEPPHGGHIYLVSTSRYKIYMIGNWWSCRPDLPESIIVWRSSWQAWTGTGVTNKCTRMHVKLSLPKYSTSRSVSSCR